MSKAMVAMVCITVMVVTGMFLGLDGYLYGLGVAAVSGLGGFAVRWGAGSVNNNRRSR